MGLVRVAYAVEDHDTVLADLANRVSPRVLRAPDRVAVAARQLEEYFAGRRQGFDLPLDLRLSAGFRRSVLDELRRIEFGGTRSYAEIAVAAGSPRAVRAVGSACATNPIPVVVPCHRVVRADGAPAGTSAGWTPSGRCSHWSGPPRDPALRADRRHRPPYRSADPGVVGGTADPLYGRLDARPRSRHRPRRIRRGPVFSRTSRRPHGRISALRALPAAGVRGVAVGLGGAVGQISGRANAVSTDARVPADPGQVNSAAAARSALHGLRAVPLFDGLADGRLAELAAAGELRSMSRGDELFHEGRPGRVLVGTGRRRGRDDPAHRPARTSCCDHGLDRVSGPAGCAPGTRARSTWPPAAVATGRVLRVPTAALRDLADCWFPFGVHLITGLMQTVRRIESMARQREKLIALGTLSAGLAHELNNPAAAASRAVDALSEAT